ncbi:MAG: sensor domain-containing diguanylate cyclase/phosphohydrolase [Romboutsia sp.]|uniref:sensor domain-containing diguanylate cyclase/phosphohydrolase n=1 Tax=Romboutsia sp. TaxID=1965302 RepID=UPI003F30688D
MFDNMLEILLDNIPYSIWLVDNKGYYIFVNEYFCNHINMCKEDLLGKNIHEIYGDVLGDEYMANYKEVKELGSPKLFTGYQDDIFLECYIAPIKKDEKIVSYLGILQDQTKRKVAEEQIIKQKKILNTLIDTIPDSIFYKNIEGEYVDCNVAFANDYYNTNKEDIIGKKDTDIIKNKKLIKSILETDLKVIDTKIKYKTNIIIENEDNKKYMECIKTPLLDEENNVWGIVGASRDITQRILSERELKKNTYTDKLTKVYNRAYFDKKVEDLNQEKYLPLSLIMGDVDGLKVVNDTLGHLKGDELLVQISNVLKNVCKNEGLVVRWGGDEFVILLPNTEIEKSKEICKKIILQCQTQRCTSIPLRISLGCASKEHIDQNIDEILKEAEEQLYKQKLPSHINSKKRTLDALNEALIEKSIETKEHTDRVVGYAKRLGKKLKLNDKHMKELIISAQLHDIGKIGIQNEILSKPGKLTNEEFNIIKTHTEKGYRVAKSNYEIAHIANNILSHHEKWNGTGYPLGLKGKEIPYLSRVICIVDSYDAMISKRSYKEEISNEDAIEEIKRCSGTQFDPKIVKVFIEEFKNINK